MNIAKEIDKLSEHFRSCVIIKAEHVMRFWGIWRNLPAAAEPGRQDCRPPSLVGQMAVSIESGWVGFRRPHKAAEPDHPRLRRWAM